jgi:hypothetical protein
MAKSRLNKQISVQSQVQNHIFQSKDSGTDCLGYTVNETFIYDTLTGGICSEVEQLQFILGIIYENI